MILKINQFEEYKIILPEKDELVEVDKFYSLVSRLHIISKSLMKDPLIEISKEIPGLVNEKKKVYSYPHKRMIIETREQCLLIAKDYFFLTKDEFNKKYSPNKTIDFGSQFFGLRKKHNIQPSDIGFTQWPSISQSKQKDFRNILIK
jgi:hypothetical protein